MAEMYKKKGELVVKGVKLPITSEMELDVGNSIEVDIKVVDNRIISDKQRAFIFVLCREIGWHLGEEVEYVRLLMQQYNANLRDIDVVSLANCTMTYANNLIETIITFAIDNNIPLAKKILEDNEYHFTDKQTYAMVLKRMCVVCGRRADIHHTTAVGMGKDRNKISHIGLEVLPLCREHHNEAHQKGNEFFNKKYHLRPITVDDKLDYFIKKGKIKIYEGD